MSQSKTSPLKSFIKLPWKVYRGNPYWAPPLIREELRRFNPRTNPFFQHGEAQLFLAVKDGDAIWRIAAIISGNRNRSHSDRTGFFAFLECLPDFSAACWLFHAGARWLGKGGVTELLITEMVRAIRKAGYTSAEMSRTLEDNRLINKAMETVGTKPYEG